MLAGSTSKDFVAKISEALTEAERKGIYVTAESQSTLCVNPDDV